MGMSASYTGGAGFDDAESIRPSIAQLTLARPSSIPRRFMGRSSTKSSSGRAIADRRDRVVVATKSRRLLARQER